MMRLTTHPAAFDLDSLISRAPKPPNAGSTRPAHTPARTPAPTDLEYLDVFDFFNMPRLPTNANMIEDTNGNAQDGPVINTQQPTAMQDQPMNGLNEFNITNFMFDANTDWLGS